MDNRSEAVRGAVGCLAAAVGGIAGILVWAPYGRRGIFGFEGETEWNVLRLGLPVMLLGGIAAGIGLFALVRGKWRTALGATSFVAALAVFGVEFDVLAGPLSDCGPKC
ncbi:hypothetical protein [Streptomyces sp. NPDC014734]|uniref:hypothetical protein n=1 Tax=Streptomyces sp. NPDC014734 TaxID=3364886 RepID=UPI0036FA9F57